MSDDKGVLPSGRHTGNSGPEEKERGGKENDPDAARLPSVATRAEIPTAPQVARTPGPVPPTPPAEPPGPPPPAAFAGHPWSTTFGPQTLEQRLSAATLQGGWQALPPHFGDSGGDWETVVSANPFEVLFLDYRLAQKITPEMVEVQRKLLRAFWQDKIKTMSQGAGRLAIARKYGGAQADENRVRSFPDLVEQAYHRLSTANGIAETFTDIVVRKERAALDKIEAKLSDFLVDGALHPQEAAALFELADREGVSREVVAAQVEKQIRQMGLVGKEAAFGTTLEERLRSTTWIHPSQLGPALAPAPPPTKRSPVIPALVAMVALGVGFAVWQVARQESPNPSVLAKPAQDPVVHPIPPTVDQKPAPQPPKKESTKPAPPTVSAADLQAVRREIEAIVSLVDQDPQAAEARARTLGRKLADEPRAYAGERRHLSELDSLIAAALREVQHRADLEQIRSETEKNAAEGRVKSWEDQLARVERFNVQGNHDAAQTLAQELLAEPELPASLALRAHQLVAEAAGGRERASLAAWEVRLQEIERLSQNGIYTEAKSKADALMGEEGVPGPIAERARRLSADALAALQSSWKKAKIKSKTVRASDGKNGGG